MSKKLNIVLQCRSLGVGKGGVERVATEMANEMISRGHTIHIGYRNHGNPAYKVNQKIKLLPYDSIETFKQQVRQIDPDVFFVFYVNHLLIEDYSIIHGTNIPFAIQECSNPLRICHNNWKTNSGSPFKAFLEREVIASSASRIRLTMKSYKDSFPDYIRNNIFAFSNPAFPQNYISKKSRSFDKRKTILNINGFKANKNLISLVKAFYNIQSLFPDWDLKIVGKTPRGDAKHEKEILDFIKNNNFNHRVIIRGPTDNIYSELAKAELHVISSLSEGCPTVVLEAMSVGLPSIGYDDCSGTNELIEHGKNGLLAESKDRVTGLEISLSKLMKDHEFRKKLGCNALNDSKAFHPNNIYNLWERLFFEVSEYKNDPDRLLREQKEIDYERAIHSKRMRDKLMLAFKE